jgi:hypothetical protein
MGLFTPLIGRLTGKRPDLADLPEDALLTAPSAEALLNAPQSVANNQAGGMRQNTAPAANPAKSVLSPSGQPAYAPPPGYGPPADNPFQPVIDALQRGLYDFACKQLQTDLYINPRYRFEITRIDLRPRTPEADQCLQAMLARYPAAHLAGFMQRTLFGTLPNGKHIDTRHFAGIQRLPLQAPPPPAPDSPEGQGADFASICAELGEAPPPLPHGQQPPAFDCFIHGRLVEDNAPPVSPTTPQPATTSTQWLLRDALGEREINLDPASADNPITLGKGEQNALVLQGTFVSSQHGQLWFAEGCWWYLDTGSTNGSRVEAPDASEHSFPPVRERTTPCEPLRLPPGSRILLGTTVAGLATPQTANAYPCLQVPVPQQPSAATPVAAITTITAATTPLVPTAPVTPPLALLLVSESEAQQHPRRIPLTGAALPFSIGRSSQQSLTVPEVHRSVSGTHLCLLQVTEAGIEIELTGQNGAQRGEALLPAGYHGLWAWGETLRLGHAQDGEPPYMLQLVPPES